MLELGTSLNYTEVDAATNSGVEAMRKLTEEIMFSSFSGNRRIYLFDESHRLSRESYDALLKPLEDTIPGTQDKKLVCIFCTTEPEKMRNTILSRCAPAFVIQSVSPDEIAQRLAWVCDQEKVEYDIQTLRLIAEVTECHIRDALKATEGVSVLGAINEANVRTYLHLDLNLIYLDVLDNLGSDFGAVTGAIHRLLERVSPVTCYERLVDLAMLAYETTLGNFKPPTFWDAARLKAIGQKHGDSLLGFTSRLGSRPGKPNASMLLCDLGYLHHAGGRMFAEQPLIVASAPAQLVPQGTAAPETSDVKSSEKSGKLQSANTIREYDGVQVSSLAVGKRIVPSADVPTMELAPSEFCRLLALRIAELGRE